MVKYYAESGVSENTPTPVTTQTQLSPSFTIFSQLTFAVEGRETKTNYVTTRPTNDPTFTDTNTDVLIGDDGTTFKKITDTPAGTTDDPDGGYLGLTSTAAGQTTLLI